MRTTAITDDLFNAVYRGIAYTSPASIELRLLTAVTDMRAGTVTQTTYTGYAAQTPGFNAPTGANNGRECVSTAEVFFGIKTDAGSVNIIAVGEWDGTRYVGVNFVNALQPLRGNAASSNVTADTIQAPNHGLAAGQVVRLEAVAGPLGLPGGLAENTDYEVSATNLATDVFSLEPSGGGPVINISAIGEALVMPYTPLVVNQNDNPRWPAGAHANTWDG